MPINTIAYVHTHPFFEGEDTTHPNVCGQDGTENYISGTNIWDIDFLNEVSAHLNDYTIKGYVIDGNNIVTFSVLQGFIEKMKNVVINITRGCIMKNILVIIFSFVIYINCTAQERNKISCPEQEESDIIYINYFLSSPKFDAKKEELGIPVNRAKQSDLITQDLEGLKNYLKGRGVTQVTSSVICEKINIVLDEANQYHSDKIYRETIFFFGDKYLIFFIPIKNIKRDKKGGWPVIILNNDFNIIDSFEVN